MVKGQGGGGHIIMPAQGGGCQHPCMTYIHTVCVCGFEVPNAQRSKGKYVQGSVHSIHYFLPSTIIFLCLLSLSSVIFLLIMISRLYMISFSLGFH